MAQPSSAVVKDMHPICYHSLGGAASPACGKLCRAEGKHPDQSGLWQCVCTACECAHRLCMQPGPFCCPTLLQLILIGALGNAQDGVVVSAHGCVLRRLGRPGLRRRRTDCGYRVAIETGCFGVQTRVDHQQAHGELTAQQWLRTSEKVPHMQDSSKTTTQNNSKTRAFMQSPQWQQPLCSMSEGHRQAQPARVKCSGCGNHPNPEGKHRNGRTSCLERALVKRTLTLGGLIGTQGTRLASSNVKRQTAMTLKGL